MAEKRRPATPRTPRSRTTKPEAKETPSPASPASSAPTPASSATDANPLGLEPDTWDPPEQPLPADADLGGEYEPPVPELLEWTPERAGALVRAGGFLLHSADGLSREPEGGELWRATEADVEAIAPPLARILNRYEPARRLAGVSDEMELALGMVSYARKNLAERGRVATARKQRELAAEATEPQPGTWPDNEPTQPEA